MSTTPWHKFFTLDTGFKAVYTAVVPNGAIVDGEPATAIISKVIPVPFVESHQEPAPNMDNEDTQPMPDFDAPVPRPLVAKPKKKLPRKINLIHRDILQLYIPGSGYTSDNDLIFMFDEYKGLPNKDDRERLKFIWHCLYDEC